MQHRRKKENPNNSIPVEDTMKRPDQNWVQCDGCLKWRRVPDGIDCKKLPDEWFCRMNPDPQFRSCNVEEEPEDSDDEQPSYRKTYKEQEREDKMKKEKIQQARQILEQQEKERFAAIAAQNSALKKQHDKLRRQLRQMSPSTSSNVGSSSLQEGTVRAVTPPLRTTTISQAAMSPSMNNGLPVVTVVSLVSANPPALKRTQPSPLSTPKRPRVNLPHRISGTLAERDTRSPSVPPHMEDLDDTTTINYISILESSSTPMPAKPVDDVTKVQKEQTEEGVNGVSMLLDCTDDAAVESPSEKNTAETGRPTVTVSGTEESQSLAEGNQTVESNRETHVEKSTTEVQKQQDDLLELLQDAIQERDGFKEELQKVTCQLQEMQKKLSEASQKTSSKQSFQAEKSEERDYKALFERVKQKVQDLMKDKQALIAAARRETKLSAEEKDIDEISLQVGCLVQELDKRNQELDELRLQLNSLEEERLRLAAECAEKPGGSAEPDEARRSLIELRQNVGRLLVSSMPALELDQVNYECNVIDEILEQYLSGIDSN